MRWEVAHPRRFWVFWGFDSRPGRRYTAALDGWIGPRFFVQGELGVMADNSLCYGDNIEIMCRYIPDEPVDLMYLELPGKHAISWSRSSNVRSQ